MSARAIRITAGTVSVRASLNGSRTADAVWEALPIAARAQTWGDEIYFGIGVKLEEESPREVVDEGDLAYWPPGQAFCIFFGRTPASLDDRPRAASPANPIGRVLGDASRLRDVIGGAEVLLEKG